ncbi:MAG: hypothetical protein ACTHMC_03445 [Pseudobacter sp.]|uniref:hypothetical protein n=1 Tax=Pseudobacter sp. TaxID=2045420 RepID=UPI003F7CE02E
MKATLTHAASLLLLLAVQQQAGAQQTAPSVISGQAAEFVSETAPAYLKTTSYSPASNLKLKNAFARLFPDATNQQWVSNEAGSYFVSFLQHGRSSRASFSRKGLMNYMIAEAGAATLPAALATTINKQYSGYKLLKALEVHAFEAISWQVVLEDASGYVTLQHVNGVTEQVQQLKKS